MEIEALGDSVLFDFVQTIKKGMFHHDTDWGFTMDKSVDYDVRKSRWGQVVFAGPDVENVKVDDYILIEGAKWTNAVVVNGRKLWRTKEDFIEAISDERPEAMN